MTKVGIALVSIVLVAMLAAAVSADVWTDTFDTPEGPVEIGGIGNYYIWSSDPTNPGVSYEIHDGIMDMRSLSTSNALLKTFKHTI